ncbi:MAG: hypothetical protein LBU51_08555 [Bacteroidales bacterium]|jgi:hypothetical protein|nr:hypothetical protein [Bacteroidales bacterium]
MIKKNCFPLLVLMIVGSLTLSCNRKRYSDIPRIEFVSLEKIANSISFDDKGILTFYFEDGDGDIGIDTSTPDSLLTDDDYNLFIIYYEKQNGQFKQVIPSMTMNARIPPLSYSIPESIDGTIDIEIYINNFASPYDTVKFDFYITDITKHKSNIASTGEVIIKKH